MFTFRCHLTTLNFEYYPCLVETKSSILTEKRNIETYVDETKSSDRKDRSPLLKSNITCLFAGDRRLPQGESQGTLVPNQKLPREV